MTKTEHSLGQVKHSQHILYVVSASSDLVSVPGLRSVWLYMSHTLRNPGPRWVIMVVERHRVTQLLRDLQWLLFKNRRRDMRLSLIYRIVEYILLPADKHTRSKHEHKYKHFTTTCEQYQHHFFVHTVPGWNFPPEAYIKADTTRVFKASLCPNPKSAHPVQ